MQTLKRRTLTLLRGPLAALLVLILALGAGQPGAGITVAAGPQTAFEPQTTFDPEPEPAFGPEPEPVFYPGRLLLRFKPQVREAQAMAATMLNHDVTFVRTLYGSDVHVLEVPPGEELAVSQALGKAPQVSYAEPDYMAYAFLEPLDPGYSNQWAHRERLGSEMAWDITTGASDVVIAVLDSGIDPDHPDLAAKIVPGWDFVAEPDDADPRDENGHGTHVAGIAAAVTDNGAGGAGMSWGARIMPVRVLNEEGNGWNSDITSGIHWARTQGARIINLSLGSTVHSAAMQDAITAARDAGILVVAAMGNYNTDTPYFPAAMSNVVAVAATDRQDNRVWYSNYGGHCDLAAPGGIVTVLHDPDGIYSTMPTYEVTYNTQRGYSMYYDFLQGTSQATAYVSGLAALLWSVDPDLSPGEVETVMRNTAVDIEDEGWDAVTGYGRINAKAALDAVNILEAPHLLPIANPTGDDAYWVAWEPITNAVGYHLHQAANLSFHDPVTFTTTMTRTWITGRQGGTWYYRVRAYNNSGTGEWSNVQSTGVRPRTPQDFAIFTTGATDAYRLSWQGSVGAHGYRLQESATISFTHAITRYLGASTSYTVTGQPGGTWYYRVTAYNSSGHSAPTTPLAIAIPTSPVTAPHLLPVERMAGKTFSVTLQWDSDITTTTTYTLEESPRPYFLAPTTIYSGPLTMTTHTVPGRGTFYYRVRAHTMAGHSPWSNVQTTVITAHVHLPLITRAYQPDFYTTIRNGGFEEGALYWTQYSSNALQVIVHETQMQSLPPHGGEWAAWLGGLHNETSAVEQEVEMISPTLFLNYWYLINSEAISCTEDLGRVYIDDTAVYTHELCAENTGAWQAQAIDLSAYLSETVTLRFEATTDDTETSSLFIDDISLAMTPVQNTVQSTRLNRVRKPTPIYRKTP